MSEQQPEQQAPEQEPPEPDPAPAGHTLHPVERPGEADEEFRYHTGTIHPTGVRRLQWARRDTGRMPP